MESSSREVKLEESEVSKTSENPEDVEHYFRTDHFSFSVGGNVDLVYSIGDRTPQLLPSYLTLLLEQCQTPQTLGDHAQDWSSTIDMGRRAVVGLYVESVTEQVRELIERKLLISDRELMGRLREAATKSEADPPSIQTIGILTRNRTAALQRCLESYIENCRRHERDAEFVIVDDSETAEARVRTREILRQAKQQYGVKIAYAGAEEKQHFMEALIARGDLPDEVVEFALFDVEKFGYSDGKNRNALFLHTAGEMFYSTDDDTVCRLAVASESDTQDIYDDDLSPREPMELWFYPNRETAIGRATFVDESILSMHERLLGRSVASVVSELGDLRSLTLADLKPWDLRSLQSGEGKVLVTFNGLIGDSGMNVPPVFQVLSPRSRERLINSEQEYLASRFSRDILRVVRHPNVSRRTWSLSTSLAYDNRSLLPPFVPVLRGADGVLVETLIQCFENGYVANLPWAVLHLPPEDRSYLAGASSGHAVHVTASRLLSACILSWRPLQGNADSASTLRRLGEYLVELASLSGNDFEEFARLQVWESESRRISRLEEELKDFRAAPGYWAEDLDDYLSALREAMNSPDYIIPRDVLSGRSKDEARRLIQLLVLRFGQLLQAWPAMFEAAKELREHDERLAVRL